MIASFNNSKIKIIEEKIKEIRNFYIEKFNMTIFDIDFELNGNDLILTGCALLRRQKRRLEKEICSIFDGNIINKIYVLESWQYNKNCSLYFLSSQNERKCVNVYRSFIENFYDLSRKERIKLLSNQLRSQGLLFRIIKEYNRWILVQIVDGTLGWVRKRVLEKCQIEEGNCVFNDNFHKDREFFENVCKKFFGLKYLLGGNNGKYIDCSALVQNIVYECFGLLLPKKTINQKAYLEGKKIRVRIHPDYRIMEQKQRYLDFIKNSNFGGLIFFQKKEKPTSKHVGIWYDKEKNLVLHSSQSRGGVVIEDLDQVLGDYDFY